MAAGGNRKVEQGVQRPSGGRLYDLAAASPLIVFYAFAVAGFFLQIHREILSQPFSRDLVLAICSNTAFAALAGLEVGLFLTRKLPVAKSRRAWPRIVAFVGAQSALLFLALPSATPPPWLSALSTAITIAGAVASFLVLWRLGRSFSVTPQARALVTGGPYRFVRHPLYLAEQIGTFGIMWRYAQPWGALVFLVSLGLQFPRMHYEEEVLAAAFPAYRAYAARTKRLIPWVY